MSTHPILVLIAACVLIVATSACGDSAASDDALAPSTTTFAPSTTIFDRPPEDPRARLGGLVNALEEAEGALLTAEIDFTSGRPRLVEAVNAVYLSFSIEDVDVIWAPTPDAAAAASQLEEVLLHLSDDEEAAVAEHLGDSQPAIIYYDPAEKNSELVALGLEPGNDLVDVTGSTFRLGPLADELAATPLTVVDRCAPTAATVPSPGREAALLEHIEALEARTAHVAKKARIERIAQRLVDNNPWTDPVTGENVEPDINDLIRQLEAGVRAKNVDFGLVVPMVIDLRTWEREPRHGFVFSASGDYLGAMGVGKADELWIADVPVPRDGSDLVFEVALEPIDTCGNLPRNRESIAHIPYADAAGPNHRALVNFADGGVTPLTAEDFRLLVEGES